MSGSLPILSLCITKGETVAIPLRIETETLTYKTITGVSQSGPVAITAAAHGLTDGWPAALMNIVGPVELNAEENPPEEAAYRPVTVVDANTVQFNGINSAGYRTYVSGGQLVYHAPLDLTAYSIARMSVKDRVGGTEILLFSTDDATLEIDSATQTLWVRLSDEASAAITASDGVFDIELETPGGEVRKICSSESEIEFADEVTT